MSRTAAAVGITFVIAWYALAPLPWPAQAMAAALLVVLPALAVAQARALAGMAPEQLPRIPVYVSSIVSLVVLAFLCLLAASSSGFTPGIIGLRAVDSPVFLAWVIVGVGAAAVLLAVGKVMNIQEAELLTHLLPVTRRERAVFVVLAITAGVCEEIIFRGFLIPSLSFVIGSTLVAALLSSALFGVMHAYQDRFGAARAATLGFALAAPMLIADTILPSIAAHTAIDLIGGLWLVRRTV